MSFSLKEELICDHLVTSEVKRLWQVEMSCFEEVAKICKKYNLRYYASGGTLLGAVRHQGFIPWDDDMDIVMPYSDYVKFCDIASRVLPSPFFLQDYRTEPGFGPGLARVRNSDTTGCTHYEYEHFASTNYNCGIFIDIFPLFGVEEDTLKRVVQRTRMFVWWLGIAGYESLRKSRKSGNWVMKLLYPPIWYWRLLNLFYSHVDISRKFLEACNSAKDYIEIGFLSFEGFNPKFIYLKEWYNDTVYLPFHELKIAAPKEYDKVLRKQYGDYMVFKKGGAIHTMELFDTEISFKEKMNKRESHNND